MENKDSRKRYEELLFERDRFKKQANKYLGLYIHEFGELMTVLFKIEISCIKIKKMIAFCQLSINRCEPVNVDMMNRVIDAEMTEYNERLEGMIRDNDACKELTTITQNEMMAIKKVYRKIAKKLHPDLNPLTAGNEELSELWNDVSSAYHCNDLAALQELDIRIDSALEKLGAAVEKSDIPDIEDKIKSLEKEIEEIISTDPYQYKYILDDDSKISDMKEELQNEIKEYKAYEESLKNVLKSLIGGGATFLWES